MARASFTLRQEGTNLPGSYLQYPPTYDTSPSSGLRTLDDGILRADGYQIAPILSNVVPGGNQYTAVAFFSVEAVDYGVTHLEWGVPLTAASAVGVTPVATQVIIAYSPDGEPDTVNEGSVLVETITDSQFFHDAPSGKWAYYTLFLKYQGSTGDIYYEPAAKLSVLVPKNFGSTDLLFNHIPSIYREMDGGMDNGSGGPLYRYLSIFGWDADRIRTLVEYFIGCRDPMNSRTEELDALASELGLSFSSVELGTSRLRAFMNDIGSIRRGTGIATTLSSALSSLTGSEVVVDTATRNIYVKPQRVNLFKDPLLVNSPANSLDGGAANTTVYTSSVDGGSAGSSVTYSANTDGGAASTTYSATTGYWTYYSDPTQSNTTIFEMTGPYLYIEAGKVFYFSVDSSGQEFINKVRLFYTSGGSRVEIASDLTATKVGGRRYWKLSVPTTFTSASMAALSVEYTSTPTGPTALFKNILLEENNIGPFFYGGTSRGGWVKDDAGAVSDFRWYSPTQVNDSLSVYSANYQKTKFVVSKMLPLLLPVTELVTSGTVYSNQPVTVNKWTVNYNYIPGYPA